MSTPFDTLGFVHRLQKSGVERETAEAHAELLRDMVWSDLAKKDDIARLEDDIGRVGEDLKRVENSLRADMKRMESELKTELDHKLHELELRMTIKPGGMLAVMLGLIVTAQKLL